MNGNKLSCCCISHEFLEAATRNPNKIAVIHASGGSKIARKFRNENRENTTVSDTNYDKFYGDLLEMAVSSCPSVYNGDRCFTFSEILSAIDSLSYRLRCILDGEDDPYLVKVATVNVPSEQPMRVCISEGSKSSSAGLEYSIEDQFHCTPKVLGIYMEPSAEYIVAVLSVLRCGEAFIPLDPSWPKERISSIVSSSNVILIIRCQSSFDGNGCYGPYEHELVDWSFPEVFISMKENLLQELGSSSLAWPCENEKSRLFCYLMYTSGSTGKPKGVRGTEAGLVNRFLWMQEFYPLGGEELLLFKTPISFIDHLQEFLGTLLTTCTLVIPPFDELKENIFYVHDFLQAYSINRLIAVPSLMRAILPALQSPYNNRVQSSLKTLVLSGEVFPISLWEMLYKLLPKTTILNLYGSTEVSGDCSYFDCKMLLSILEREALDSVPIGMPISHCNLVLVGENSPMEGEIYVGGLCNAAGYNCDISASSSGFLVHDLKFPHYFKTGDFARQLESGYLVFLGRKDRTLKVNGQRIALEEIESTLRGYPGVVDATVISSRGHEEVELLQAHLIMKRKDTGSEILRSIRSWMLKKLPLPMIPSCFFFSESFPLSSTGKVDYAQLASVTPSVKRKIQSTELLQVIKKAFCDALMVETVSDADDFFKMGGNSILAAHVSHILEMDMRLLYIYSSPMKLLQMALIGKKGLCDTLCKKGDDFSGTRQMVDSDFYRNVKRICFGDVCPWDCSSFHVACSFSRCNKVACEGSVLCKKPIEVVIPRNRSVGIKEVWRAHTKSCVDASPLIVFKCEHIFVLIGSHSFKFLCIDAKSGFVQWEAQLEGRIECSAEIVGDFSQVVVGCYEGNIYFLDLFGGNISWRFRTGGEVKCQPVVDKRRNLVWCGSHDYYLYALDYRRYCCVYKLFCGGSLYGSPVIDEVRDILYVASTCGRVTSLSIKSMLFSELWHRELESPIFGSLSIYSREGNVLCCLVDGHVVALDAGGSIIWKVKTGGPVFAGPCTSYAIPSQALVCSRDGRIYSFELEKGDLLWEHNLGDPVTSSAYVDENLELVSNSLHIRDIRDRVICACTSSGSVYLLRVPSVSDGGLNQRSKDVVQELARLDLPGDIFSSPVMTGGRIFVGCRDDYVYCLGIDTPPSVELCTLSSHKS